MLFNEDDDHARRWDQRERERVAFFRTLEENKRESKLAAPEVVNRQPQPAQQVAQQEPKWTPADESMRWLNEVELAQGGSNGPTIKLRAALLALIETKQQEPAQDEPVMIYHGRCTIDCGEHGHQDVEMLKMIPAGSKLYTHPQASKPNTAINGERSESAA